MATQDYKEIMLFDFPKEINKVEEKKVHEKEIKRGRLRNKRLPSKIEEAKIEERKNNSLEEAFKKFESLIEESKPSKVAVGVYPQKPKKCPLCGKKVRKSKVRKKDGYVVQYFTCGKRFLKRFRKKGCDYMEEIKFELRDV